MSKLYVDQLVAKTTGNKIIMPQGGIIQTQYTMFTGTNTISTSLGADIVVTDLTVNITPQSSSSVIKLEGMVNGEWSNGTATYNSGVFFFRDNTKLSHPTAGSRPTSIAPFSLSIWTSDAASTAESTGTFQYYDTPNTTSQITYKVGIITTTAGAVFHLNKTVNDLDSNGYERFISLISATEIAG